MEFIDLIKHAIAKRLVLEIEYDGRVRLVEPWTLKHTLRGALCLGANWVGGYSKSGDRGSRWRQFDLEKITAADLVTEPGCGTARRPARFAGRRPDL